jgi:hypothetical protein
MLIAMLTSVRFSSCPKKIWVHFLHLMSLFWYLPFIISTKSPFSNLFAEKKADCLLRFLSSLGGAVKYLTLIRECYLSKNSVQNLTKSSQ